MSQTSNSLHRDRISCPRARIAQCVVDGNSRTKQRCSIFGGKIVGNASHCFLPRKHVLLISAIEMNSRDFRIAAVDEIPAAARVTHKAMPAVPAYPHAIATLPHGDIFAHSVDTPRNLVPWRTRILQSPQGPMPFFDNRVTVTDPTGLDLDAYLSASRLRNRSLNNFEITSGTRKLDGFHRAWHAFPLQ